MLPLSECEYLLEEEKHAADAKKIEGGATPPSPPYKIFVVQASHRRQVGQDYKGWTSVADRLLHGVKGANQLSDRLSWLNWANLSLTPFLLLLIVLISCLHLLLIY